VSGTGVAPRAVTKDDVLNAGNGSGNGASRSPPARRKTLRGTRRDARQSDGREPRGADRVPRSERLPSTTLDAKRKAINAALKERGLKTSFTHLIAWAIVEATKDFPVMVRHLRRTRRQTDRDRGTGRSTSASPSTSPAKTAPTA